jgi:ligand-binding SRPBCC domain-containing protein
MVKALFAPGYQSKTSENVEIRYFKNMKTFEFSASQFLSTDLETAWDFFSSAKNLAVITPPELDFKILTNLGNHGIYEGMLIEYQVRPLFHIPVYWKTEIASVKKPEEFMDRQLQGPYKSWEHTHIFIKKQNGVLMKDEVKYQLPFGIIGQLNNTLIVRRKIEHIFAYRTEILNQIFNKNGNNNY